MHAYRLRNRHAVLLAAALGLASGPSVLHAQTLFSDDFNTDSTSRYDVYSFDNSVSTTAVVAGVGTNDVTITPAFNYSAYTYRHISDDEIDTVYDPIPIAPHTTDGTSIGLRLDANNTSVGGTGTAIINLLPKVTQFTGGVLPTGNYQLTVDVWMNYNGTTEGGGGSTEYMIAGVNQSGTGNGLAGPVVKDPAVQQAGQAIAIDGERGSGIDYRLYSQNSRLGASDPSAGYVQPVSTTYSGADAQGPYYESIFTYPSYETDGAIGKHWVTLQASYIDGVVSYSLDAHLGGGMQLIASRTDLTSTSGDVALGYADLNSGIAALENSGPISNVDANFVIYDNLTVEQLPASAPKPAWTAAAGSWTDGTKWVNGVPNSSTSFATFSASAAGATVTIPSSGVTVQEIDLDNAGMTIAGPGPLIMDSLGTTGGVMGTINVKQGAQTISAPVTVNKNLMFYVAQAGSSLTFTQPLPDTSYQFTMSGNGTVNLRGGRNGGLIVLGGKINLVPGSGTMSTAGLLVVGPIALQRGSIDINDNKFIDDYTGALGSASSNVRGTINGAYAAGAWTGNGLTSSLAINDSQKIKGLGYWEAATLLGLSDPNTATWFGQQVDATALLVAVTYLGDLNFDGKVNADDYALIDRSFALYGIAVTADPRGIPTGTAVWAQGDVNYDGIINSADYAIMDRTYGILSGGLSPDFLAGREAEFGSDYVSSLVASIPEPGTIGLLLAALPMLKRRRVR
ncbi:MAG TPA: dockerin type I repeat-containing protein [Tepidisphaeraceae bacterium]|jgi:hypothetical protein|nr:dockerin type I repeat-containing protein [Tepidisphaeraceae bacterium]